MASSSSSLSICISSSSILRACSSQHITKKQATQPKQQARSIRSKNTASADIEPLKLPDISPSQLLNEEEVYENMNNSSAEISSYRRFSDERWRNGTWDLNMFVKKGKMDWDAVIEAEAKRRRFLELYPEASSNEEPVLFRSSIIPWWAWILHSHLPEAELLNGRAAMLGFFTAYVVDALTGINVVGQTGNFICKAALFVTVIGILVFRKKEDFEYVRNLADEATFYDKQWQASWKNTHNVVKDKLQK